MSKKPVVQRETKLHHVSPDGPARYSAQFGPDKPNVEYVQAVVADQLAHAVDCYLRARKSGDDWSMAFTRGFLAETLTEYKKTQEPT